MATCTPEQEVRGQAEECADKEHADEALKLLKVDGYADAQILFNVTLAPEATPLDEPARVGSADWKLLVHCTGLVRYASLYACFLLQFSHDLAHLALITDVLHL